jgi:hypothetical protein
MKRDMDLVRTLLRMIEEDEGARGSADLKLDVEGRTAAQVSYHVMLMGEAVLIVAERHANLQFGPTYRARRLTWQGHEFLAAAADDSRWERAKRHVVEKVGSLSFEALSTVLFGYVRDQLS